MSASELASASLFAGLTGEALDAIRPLMRPRSFAAQEPLCRAGEPGESLFIIARGLAHVLFGEGEEQQVIARLRRGDVVGEMSLLSGEPRSATVLAVVPTEVLELDRATFSALLAAHPVMLDNLVRLLRERLMASNLRAVRPPRHAAALVVADGADAAADAVIDELLRVRAAPLVLGDRRRGAPISRLLDEAQTTDVVAVLRSDDPALVGVLDYVDRAAFLGEPRSFDALRAREDRLVTSEDPAWLGRYLARGRLGLALGAGGARGYAHVGALRVLHDAGYSPDVVAGSSIGGVIGACVAMGMDPDRLESTLRGMFTPDTVSALFRLSLGPTSPAMTLWTRLLREMTEDRDFSDLPIPLTVMTVDLESGQPAPLTEGPVWEALLATTALPGMAPPLRRGEQRLVDGLALVPVPTMSVEPLSDVTVAVNLMNRETLPRWPGDDSPPPPRGSSALDILLEAMELTHVEVSTRHAARADVPITPRFGPSTWKDFHRADDFLAAGELAAREQLGALRALLHPRREPA